MRTMPEMVPLGSIMSKSQYKQMMFMMSRPRFDASTPVNAVTRSKDDFLGRVEHAEARDASKVASYIAYQRSQREPVCTGGASQPVGGRAARQFKIMQTARESEWTEADERAYMKAFKKSSTAR